MEEKDRKEGLASGEFYDNVGLLEEAQRYQTSERFLEILHTNFYSSDYLLSAGTGPRLLATCCSVPRLYCGRDINPGSIHRAKEFVRDWKKYRDVEPFKTEFDFLEKKKLEIRFDNAGFSLKEAFPKTMDSSADGYLASELFLHMSPEEVKITLQEAQRTLYNSGRVVFTVYPTGKEDSLDKQFANLAGLAKIERKSIIKDGVINIQSLARKIKSKNPQLYEDNKKRFWLDLQKIRVFQESQIEKMCKDVGLLLMDKEDVRCGMFPFAYRLVYSAQVIK